MSASQDSAAEPGFDPATLLPFTSGQPYLGAYETGLYPGAQHVPPASAALAVFVERYWRQLSQDSVARPWLLGA
jgi:hypothetical protein